MRRQNFASSLERLQEIENAIRPILEKERLWITPNEFLANVEAHRRKHDAERLNPKPKNCKPSVIRDYQLKRYVTYNRQLDFRRLEVAQ